MTAAFIHKTFHDIARNFTLLADLSDQVATGAGMMIHCLRAGGTVFFCGNGGSAADAQHLAAELVGRFYLERPGFSSVALTTNTSTLTAVGNDYGYDDIFRRQIQGLGRAGDLLVGLSTSGNSRNVVAALQEARDKGLTTIGMTGQGGGVMADLCHLCLKMPSGDTPRIQEMHIAVGHTMCELAEAALVKADAALVKADAALVNDRAAP